MKHAWMMVVAAALALSGCKDSTGPSNTVDGTYTLRTINGSNVPVVVAEVLGEFRVEVLSGEFVLRTDGTYTESVTIRETEDGSVSTTTDTFTGTYVKSGNQITFTGSDQFDVLVATHGDNTLTLTDSDFGLTLVYRK